MQVLSCFSFVKNLLLKLCVCVCVYYDGSELIQKGKGSKFHPECTISFGIHRRESSDLN